MFTPPPLPRAASLEAGGSPYSSCTYQSIEGLANSTTPSSLPQCQRMYQCTNCGIESSASSVTSTYARSNKRCNHATFIPRPVRRQNRRYFPDYYGWVSPPHSPQYQTQQSLLPESTSASASVYGGSIRSDPGGVLSNNNIPTNSSQENSGSSGKVSHPSSSGLNSNVDENGVAAIQSNGFNDNSDTNQNIDSVSSFSRRNSSSTVPVNSTVAKNGNDDRSSKQTSSEKQVFSVPCDTQTKL